MKIKNNLPRSENNEKFIRTKLRGGKQLAAMDRNALQSRAALKNLQMQKKGR